jgi:hypothetical protein
LEQQSDRNSPHENVRKNIDSSLSSHALPQSTPAPQTFDSPTSADRAEPKAGLSSRPSGLSLLRETNPTQPESYQQQGSSNPLSPNASQPSSAQHHGTSPPVRSPTAFVVQYHPQNPWPGLSSPVSLLSFTSPTSYEQPTFSLRSFRATNHLIITRRSFQPPITRLPNPNPRLFPRNRGIQTHQARTY